MVGQAKIASWHIKKQSYIVKTILVGMDLLAMSNPDKKNVFVLMVSKEDFVKLILMTAYPIHVKTQELVLTELILMNVYVLPDLMAITVRTT